MTPLAYWVDRLDPFLGPHWGAFGVRYYGLSFAVGFLAAAWLLQRYALACRSLVAGNQIGDLMVAVVFGVLLGGRIGSYVLYDGWKNFRVDPLGIFRVWEGGMASHGGMVGVAIALAWFARSNRIPFLHLGDLIASAAPVGLFFGRIANFINGELWGKVSYVRWAVIFPRSAPLDVPVTMIAPRHPSQLYEAFLEGLVLFVFVQFRFWRSGIVLRRPGRLAGEFLLAYALVRVIGERFREPDEGIALILGLSRGTFFSLLMVLFGAWLCIRRGQPLTPPAPPPPSAPLTPPNPAVSRRP